MLTELKKWLKKYKQDNDIFDIVIYGSIVKGKSTPGDLDLLVIFRNGTLRDRLAKIQQIKKRIRTKGKIDIKSVLLEELFQKEFFARSGIFLEGVSIFDNKPFANKIDFKSSFLFIYNLKDKSHTEKVKFNYILSGRNQRGMVEKLRGKHLAPGIIEVPAKNSFEFEEVLKMHKINYRMKGVLTQL